MSPLSQEAWIAERERLVADVELWQSRLDRHRAQQQRNMRYYDDAPDGSKQKQSAVSEMQRIGELVANDEAEISRAVDALIDHANTNGYDLEDVKWSQP